MHLVKLGGSAITDKRDYKTLKGEILRRLAGELTASGQELMVVHGAGSFGHILAKRHRLHLGFERREQVSGMAQVMTDVRELNLQVLRTMIQEGTPSVSIPPSSAAEMENGELISLALDVFERYLTLGVTPITFGDVCLDREKHFGICSGDQLMEILAQRFRPESIVFCTDVDGVFTCHPMEEDARLLRSVDRDLLDDLPRADTVDDVTGGIHGKLECMLRMSHFTDRCLVVNGLEPGRLEAALKGEEVKGSRIIGGG
ncbi:MAG: isopentenyl phosphate kinase [Methanomassiliicoccales archaeon]